MTQITLLTSILLNIVGRESAYLDPGSGSFIIQLIIASLLGAGFLLRGYFSKIRNYFRGTNVEDEEADDDIDDA